MYTLDILEVINNLEGKADNFNLKVLKEDTNEVFGTKHNYVAYETVFIYADKNNNRSCEDYKKNIKGESNLEDWNEMALDNLVREYGLNSDDDYEFNEEELAMEKFNIVANLPTRIYFGDGDFSAENYDKSYEIKNILVKDNDVILVC